MGKWDHRSSRRFFRPRRSPGPPSVFYDLKAPLPDFHQDGIPLWEKKFCTLIGFVPWQKIVDSKKLMYSHSNVLNWNDSAAEEVFQSAKRRYWAEINRLPCDIILPDPDAYLDQIDWNPYIDPELIKELDHEYFAPPDEKESNAIQNKRTKTSADGKSSWECVDAKLDRTLENKVEGWNNWNDHVDDSGNVDDADNPWECSRTQRNGGLTDNALYNAAQSRGWNQVGDHMNHSRDWRCRNNALDIDCPANDKGCSEGWDNTWNQHQSRNWANNVNDNSWNMKSSDDNRAPVGSGWRNHEANEWGRKQYEKPDVSRNLDFRRNCGQWNAWNQSWQKREGSHHHTSGYNGSRFLRDDRQTSHYWRRENSKKRVSFAHQ